MGFGELFTADIVCYGAPSPGAFQSYLASLEKHAGKRAVFYAHRGHGIAQGGSAFVEYADGSCEQGTARVGVWNCAWYSYLVRGSCFRCGYHNVKRSGDMTMGDYWGIGGVAPGLEDRWGVSCLFANNRRGLGLIRSVADRLELLQTTAAEAANPSQPMLSHPPVPTDRGPFWKALYAGGFDAAGREIGALGPVRAFKDAARFALSRIRGEGKPEDDTANGDKEKLPMVDFDTIEGRGEYPVVFAAKNRDDGVRRMSSSGGMFHAIASHVIEDLGGVVYGCAFDGDLRAVHIRCETMAEAERCMGSKYSQSDMGKAIARVREDLAAGRTVLFTGTPCQVAAVRAVCGNASGGG